MSESEKENHPFEGFDVADRSFVGEGEVEQLTATFGSLLTPRPSEVSEEEFFTPLSNISHLSKSQFLTPFPGSTLNLPSERTSLGSSRRCSTTGRLIRTAARRSSNYERLGSESEKSQCPCPREGCQENHPSIDLTVLTPSKPNVDDTITDIGESQNPTPQKDQHSPEESTPSQEIPAEDSNQSQDPSPLQDHSTSQDPTSQQIQSHPKDSTSVQEHFPPQNSSSLQDESSQKTTLNTKVAPKDVQESIGGAPSKKEQGTSGQAKISSKLTKKESSCQSTSKTTCDVPFAQQFQRYFNEVPSRFRTLPANKPSTVPVPNAMKRKLTVPHTPFKSSTEQKNEMKTSSSKVFVPPSSIKVSTKFTSVCQTCKPCGQELKTPVQFSARSAPCNKISHTPAAPVCASVVFEECNGQAKKKLVNTHVGVPQSRCAGAKPRLAVKPFSFVLRDEQVRKQRDQKLRRAYEESVQFPKFTANPLPAYLSEKNNQLPKASSATTKPKVMQKK